MKFLNYLQEDNSNKTPEHIFAILEKECAPFLHFIEKNNYLFTRLYTKFNTDMLLSKFTTRTDRKPLSTNRYIHTVLDNLFHEKFGWYVRSSGVFTYPIPYSVFYTDRFRPNVGVCFPVGQFDIVYSKTSAFRDLYAYLYEMWAHGYRQETASNDDSELQFASITGKESPRVLEIIKQFMLDFKNNEFKLYSDNKTLGANIIAECVFKCKEYYLVTPAVIKLLMEDGLL
jgi:hypothetical protein